MSARRNRDTDLKRKLVVNLICILLVIIMAVPLAACSSGRSGKSFMVYFVNTSYDDIAQTEFIMQDYQTKDSYSKVSELFHQMYDVDYSDMNMYASKPEQVLLNDFIIDDKGILTVDFSGEYLSLTNVQEIILRASLVLTVIQVDNISGVRITVEGEPIRYSNGQEIGIMTADDFVNIILSESGMLKQETDIILYYANEDGSKLVPVTQHLVINSNNVSIEEYIISQLLAGPAEDSGVYPVISSSVELINVVTSDRTCYINFSESFLEQEQQPVNDEIMIYSMVNSLCRLRYVSSVQILINGETRDTLHTVTDISQPFSRNRSLEAE